MKKILVLLLAIVMVLSVFASCDELYESDYDDEEEEEVEEKIICENCNAKNKKKAEFCKKCGESLSSTIKCSYCGTKNPKGNKFCKDCGNELSSMSSDSNGEIELPWLDFDSIETPTETPRETPAETPIETPKVEVEEDLPEEETFDKIGNLDPSINLNEKEITIISRDHAWMKDEVSVKNENADPINDAIFKRNQNVEKLLNVKIKNTLITGAVNADYVVIDEIKKTMGPDCPYHIAANSAYTSFENTDNGYFKNLKDVAHLDLSQDYWAPYFNAEASIGNQQYFATGAISLSLRRFTYATFFNKELATYYSLENLYDVVDDGKWTLDYQAKIISNMWSEQDGINGKTEGDSYGFLTDDGIFVDAYLSSCDIQILVKDSDDFYVLSPEKEKADEMMKQINNLYWQSGATYVFARQGDYSQFDKIRTKFASEEATMITDRLIAVESEQLKNMDAEYGIIPIPKLNEDQKNYYSAAQDIFTVYGIINSEVTDNMIDELGAVLEAMAIESERVVTPAYYSVALKGKYDKNADEWKTLDMIVDNIKIDGGVLYTIMLYDITQQFRNAVTAKKSDTSTIFNAIKVQMLQVYLDRMQDNIKSMQEYN